MGIIGLFRIGIKTPLQAILDRFIKLLPIYYTSINYRPIPVAKWFKLMEGDYSALYRVKLFNRIPNFFYEIVADMYFQFDHLEMESLIAQRDLVLLKSIAARTNSTIIRFQANELENRLKKNKEKPKNDMKLNDFIDYIELTFESIGKLDPDTLGTGRAFSMYHKAVDKNKRLEKIYSKK